MICYRDNVPLENHIVHSEGIPVTNINMLCASLAKFVGNVGNQWLPAVTPRGIDCMCTVYSVQ